MSAPTVPVEYVSAVSGRTLINSHGVVVADAENAFSFKKPARVARDPVASHKGFTTEGYPPGHVEAEKQKAFADLKDWFSKTPQQQADFIKGGGRQPSGWDEQRWMSKNRRKRVAKPFFVPEAAEECKALAEKAGWTHVVVVAQVKAA